MLQPVDILKKYWGYSRFRPLQEDIIRSVLEGRDVLTLLPTGGGKSLCYQLPALCMEGTCLVISPLIALMKDQVDQLKKQNIKAYSIYTGLTRREIDIILDNCIYGEVKLLYVSPERLHTELFIERVKQMKINLFAVDEAHCISQWGYDFRPSYLKIHDFKEQYLPDVNTIALTASATPNVIEDIFEKLHLRSPVHYKASFARPNLSYSVRKVEDKNRKILEILQNVPGSAIIYVRSRKGTKDLNSVLQQKGISSDYYHAGISNELRAKKQESWQIGNTRVMIATNAFGMGINKADVRCVIHYDIPDSPEAYYQEAGRAGRDGKRAFAVILYQQADIETLHLNLERSYPPVDFMKKVYQALANYYKIAVGSNMLSYFDFDILDFSKNFNLNSGEVYTAIKKLEEQGLLVLNESFFHPSKISFNADHDTLYKFQVANPALDPVIKSLLRLYGGELYENFVRISESQLARFLNTTTYRIITSLEHLNKLRVLTYDKQKDKPQICFLTARFDAQSLPVNEKELQHRKKIQKEKLEGMIRYVVNENMCRNRMLLDYFGEHVYENCGFCDFCIEQKKQKKQIDKERLRQRILYSLTEGSKTPGAVVRSFDEQEQEDAELMIREMTEYDELEYDSLGRLRIKK